MMLEWVIEGLIVLSHIEDGLLLLAAWSSPWPVGRSFPLPLRPSFRGLEHLAKKKWENQT
jgi:hypothetical protein